MNKTKYNILFAIIVIHLITLIILIIISVYYYKSVNVQLLSIVSFLNHTEKNETQSANIDIEHDAYIGDSNAIVSFIIISDYECDYCNQFNIEVLPKLIDNFVNKGLMNIYYKHLPNKYHPNSFRLAESALCANNQNKFWEFHSKLVSNNELYNFDSVKQIAYDLNMDTILFSECIRAGQSAPIIMVGIEEIFNLGISATPTFIINGKLITGTRPYEFFEELILSEIEIYGIEANKCD
jgi:protein-disulfide isomerase